LVRDPLRTGLPCGDERYDEDDVAELWREHGPTVEDERSFAAHWRAEHELDWPEAVAAVHVRAVAIQKDLEFSDEQIIRRAREYVEDDPRLGAV
jgi:hypothetical protein